MSTHPRQPIQHSSIRRTVIRRTAFTAALLVAGLACLYVSGQTQRGGAVPPPGTQGPSGSPASSAPTRAAPAPPTESAENSSAAHSETPRRPIGALMASLTIFVLAMFVGFEVINKVPPTLHTPLMSGSNAISGITVVGALLTTGGADWFPSFVGMVAIALAVVNIVGGFLVTHRMLAMFRKR